MRRFILICLAATLLLGCSQIPEENHIPVGSLPEGTPATLCISFGNQDMLQLNVGTKAEASPADEARVHDLYVMIFDNSSGNKIYGRFFSYEHLKSSIATLTSGNNEGWWVENKTLTGITPSVSDTRGVVKLSTEICHDAKVVLLANVVNAVSSLDRDRDVSNGDSDVVYEDNISYLNDIKKFSQLQRTKVILEQDVVNRKDLFLMMGTLPSVDTEQMQWDKTAEYDTDYKIELRPVDAKVKVMVRCNADSDPSNCFIRDAKAVYWKACSVPDRCYLFSDYAGGATPDDVMYFDSESAYFEGKESKDGYDWFVFSFYMLESKNEKKRHADSYYQREKQDSRETDDDTYSYWRIENGNKVEYTGINYIENLGWYYAPDTAPYVQFDMVLELTQEGINDMGGGEVGEAMTSDIIYTVHLGDFTNGSQLFDDYNTLRSHFYTYKIVIANSGSIFAEVENNLEDEPGQEGFLILTNDEIVNADCHYAYHSVSFTYTPGLSATMFSWYVKTPFSEGRPQTKTDPDNSNYTIYVGDNTRTDGLEPLDYKWCKFAVNDVVGGEYTTNRVKYMGEKDPATGELYYDPTWKPSKGTPHPRLMDISQLIEYIVDQNNKTLAENDFLWDDTEGKNIIRVTIFIDEYYYEENPISGDKDQDLWRRFVNAKPREMHILSDARQSRDKASDVIQSSHSVIQQSIQTIYNIYSPGLRTLWGCEHRDEIKEKVPAGWQYWPTSPGYSKKSGANSALGKENGRLNSAYIWNLYNKQDASGTESTNKEWETYMTFEVDNDQPELKTGYQGLAFSCMTRNRDNNGNGIIDREEVRWYLAASEQLIGIWVGNESLSLSARLYQPAEACTYNGNSYPKEWRAHIISSTAEKVCWAEEGAGATDLARDNSPGDPYYTWDTWDLATHGESVRCIRNIGTFDGPEGLQDISYAPYPTMVDRYFTLETTYKNPSDPSSQPVGYTFSFDRLNTKSIREYSAGELPYHEQTSLTNRVYSKMITQNLLNDPDIDIQAVSPNITTAEINPDVTARGNNPYCPPGYRFPNFKEWVLMSLYLSEDYLRKDKNGNSYSPGNIMPSRTYYDKGYYGSLKSDTEPWSTESGKVGWNYSDKMHCAPASQKPTRSRCVKDEEMTGHINGDISLDSGYIYPDDETPITLTLSSTASTLTAASLKLCYNAHNGNYREIDIPIKSPRGIEYRETQTVSIPSLAELGLTQDDIDAGHPMTLMATAINAWGNAFDVPPVNVTMVNPIGGGMTGVSNVYPSADGSVTFNFQSNARSAYLGGATLKIRFTRPGEDSPSELTIPLTTSPDGKYYTGPQAFSIPSLASLGLTPENYSLVSDMEFIARVEMQDHIYKEFSLPIQLSNPVYGRIVGVGTYIYPAGSEESVTFDFHSHAASVALSDAVLKLQYTIPGDSDPTEVSLTLSSSPSTVDYTPTQTLTIPSLYALGLTAEDLPLVANLHAEVSDVNGLKAVDDAAVTIKSHYSGLVDITDGFDRTQGFPIAISANSMTGFPIESVKLRWKQGESGSYNLNDVTVADPTLITGHSSTAYWRPGWLDSTSDVLSDNSQTRTYYFTAVVGKYDGEGHPIDEAIIGRTAEVAEATMEFFKINYNPNPGNWTYSNQPPATSKWYAQAITNLDFSSGDFIDAFMDVSNCTWAPNPKTSGQVNSADLGMDNLISIGPSTKIVDGDKHGVEWQSNNVLLYYPAHRLDIDKDNLQIAVLSSGSTSRVQPFDIYSGHLRVLLRKEGNNGRLRVNNFNPDPSDPKAGDYEPNWIDEEVGKNGHPTDVEKPTYAANAQSRLDNLISKSTLYVASTEGAHRSRAVYKYVRVVRKHD